MLSSQQRSSFIFALLMCVICGFLLTSASVGLKSKQEKNVLIDKQKNILKSLGFVKENISYSSSEIEKMYAKNVKTLFVDERGQLQTFEKESSKPIYIVGSSEEIFSYAIPFKAYGLWSWIYGYVAFDADATTVKGLTVYQHAETPGLGGEVEKAWFQNQFIGKKIVDTLGNFVSVGIVKGKASAKVKNDELSNYVDGISGATITSVGVDKYLKETLLEYENFASEVRRGYAL